MRKVKKKKINAIALEKDDPESKFQVKALSNRKQTQLNLHIDQQKKKKTNLHNLGDFAEIPSSLCRITANANERKDGDILTLLPLFLLSINPTETSRMDLTVDFR